ncbi:MAG: acid phosphatase [Burkholderiales bacterium]|nr:acid phosphatase [Burkholderiales bacterium]MDE2394492.1 acid phosphatase [Burkholderiales bacterium]
MNERRLALTSLAAAALLALGACSTIQTSAPPAATAALQSKVRNIVVIYAENRSFDNLYGHFPGADGLDTVLGPDGRPTSAYVPQKDRDGKTVLATLPQTWGGVTAPGATPVVTQAQSAGLPNAPFAVETAFTKASGATLGPDTVTRDLYHRFFENQMQIAGGANDGFAAWADAGGLTMGSFDTRGSAMYKLAQQYVLADHFFQGAFGGSFLNHQYLICACAPEYPNADTAAAKPSIAVLDKDSAGHWLPRLTTAPKSPASALDGPPAFVLSGNLTPANYMGDGKFYAVNTMQPPYQPGYNQPVNASVQAAPYADPSKGTTLPPQTQLTIGDLLDGRDVSWAWYAGGWKAALADGMQAPGQPRKVIYAGDRNGVATSTAIDFQPHHQAFNYYAAFDPARHPQARAEHLKDYDDLIAAAAAGKLPAVSFYKPEGLYNQHPGYADISTGDARIAEVVAKLQASPQWEHMVIVVTYDEFGGIWDHVPPPKGDKIGPGTRIPALVISPFAKKGTVDHTPYDTGSVLRLITRRFGLPTLPGLNQRDEALRAAGAPPMGDLTNALDLD